MASKKRDVYVIFSVDTEHDIVSRYASRSDGWTRGLPLLFEVFDAVGLRGKVMWLIEYNNAEGIPAANPDSVFHAPEFPRLVQEIRQRREEVGIHPSMEAWAGGASKPTASSYINSDLWDDQVRISNPDYVSVLVTKAATAVSKACGDVPRGCRTGGMQYATHLGAALRKNGILLDSSVLRSRGHTWTLWTAPSYYAAEDDIRRPGDGQGVLEIPTTGYIQNVRLLDIWLRLRGRLWARQRGPAFLSFFIHNWQALTTDGRVDGTFLSMLASFLRLLASGGAQFLSWSQAYEAYGELYGGKQRDEVAAGASRGAGALSTRR